MNLRKNSRLTAVVAVLAVATALFSSQAMASIVVASQTFDWGTGTAWQMDLDVKTTVYEIAGGGFTLTTGGGSQTATVGAAYDGWYAYAYDVYVSSGTGPDHNSSNLDYFQVDWKGLSPEKTGSYNSAAMSNWVYQGTKGPGDGGLDPPETLVPGDWVTWGETDKHPGSSIHDTWLGTVWAISPYPYWETDGQAPDTVVSKGRTFAPTPEPGTYALLVLALGVPFYFRRRKQS